MPGRRGRHGYGYGNRRDRPFTPRRGEVQTPLQKRLQQLGKVLVLACTAIVAVVFLAGVRQGLPVYKMFMVAVTLAVAAIPEGLPAVVTIALSVGVQRMSRQNAIIRQLPAVETLGCATVICSDKTGTLTLNQMEVRVRSGPPGACRRLGGRVKLKARSRGMTSSTLRRRGLYAPRLKVYETGTVFGDPTEVALLRLAERSSLAVSQRQLRRV